MTHLRVATVGGDPDSEAALAMKLERCSDIDLYIRCVERMELLAAIRSKSIDVLLLAGLPHWVDASLRDELMRNGVPAVGYPRDPLDAVGLEALGASLIGDIDDMNALVRACRHARPPGATDQRLGEGQSGRAVACWGSKGAPGRSMLAIELAFVLAEENPSTILIDGDPSGGDIVQALGVEPGASIIWAAQSMLDEQGGSTQVERSLARVGQRGPVLLPGLPRPSLWQDMSVGGWRRLLDWAKTGFSQVVLDAGSSFTRGADEGRRPSKEAITETALSAADVVICVVRADPIGVRNFLCEYPLLEEQVEPERMRVVLNRVESDDGSSLARSIKRQTGLYPTAQIPNEPEVMRAALKRGRSAVETYPHSALVGAVRDLAAALGAEVRPRGMLARLVGR